MLLFLGSRKYFQNMPMHNFFNAIIYINTNHVFDCKTTTSLAKKLCYSKECYCKYLKKICLIRAYFFKGECININKTMRIILQ